MFSKILKILRESISSVTNVSLWETTTKDMFLQEISGYKQMVRHQPIESSPKYSKGQLVSIKFHARWPHLLKEIGIILDVNDYGSTEKIGSIHFYEVLVGEEKVMMLERFLDGTICTEEES